MLIEYLLLQSAPESVQRPSAKSCRKAQDKAGQSTLEAF